MTMRTFSPDSIVSRAVGEEAVGLIIDVWRSETLLNPDPCCGLMIAVWASRHRLEKSQLWVESSQLYSREESLFVAK